ncbi:nitrophenyl compound nitroreductase subunit ArsF family protein [Stieleria sp. ICT_E10.1]|uniref:nitrophenyl compound nitroreductase subunit ArsF family protein n=1 Tax=Stieleria sedimenti TaxID=2976331 RepID=UPI00217FDE62|nr:nitrophenyl compound nitroreductase subunit ArsF family protein [Stieleria sedimenti]MCS7470491.1 nitrophenyl compound nitroreductase subunit ArsF family protein [Stieleria sedimenti]
MLRILVFCAVAFASHFALQAQAPDPPADRVVAMYFHRTERCPTCKMMGSYSEEAVKKGFPDQVESRSVEFRYIDYEQPKNAQLAKAYKVKGPALIIADVKENKVNEYKDLKDIWVKVRKKPEFIQYVRTSIQAYLN